MNFNVRARVVEHDGGFPHLVVQNQRAARGGEYPVFVHVHVHRNVDVGAHMAFGRNFVPNFGSDVADFSQGDVSWWKRMFQRLVPSGSTHVFNEIDDLYIE